MKIKLRDLSEEQYKYWCKKSCAIDADFACIDCPFFEVRCNSGLSNCWIRHKDLYSDKFLDQEIEIEDEPILTKKEKEYLEAVLKPFISDYENVLVIKYFNEPINKEKIEICLNGKEDDSTISWITFPYFEHGLRYRRLKAESKYTTKELGLFKDGE